MEELFGVSMNVIAVVVAILTALILALLAFVAIRNPVMFKTGLRNIPRRPAQTTLIVFGLMLATVIMTVAFGTGDTLSNSVTDDLYQLLGETDMTISWDEENQLRAEDERVVPLSFVDDLQAQFADDPDIDGFLAVIAEVLPTINTETGLNEAATTIVAYDSADAEPFGSLRDLSGDRVSLSGNQIVINEDLAGEVDAEVGHTLLLLFEGEPVEVVVSAIAPNSLLSGSFDFGTSAFPGGAVSFDFLAQVVGHTQGAEAVLVTNTGGVLEGLDRSDIVEEKLNAALVGTPYKVEATKKDLTATVEGVANAFTGIFLIFGLFTIAAGILLIFLIFIMLAAERKPEMGMARAVGAKRRHLVESFLAEGMGYDLGAAVVGLVVGVGVTFGMVALLNSLGDGFGVEMRTSLTARSLLISFCLGVVSTFIVIFFAAVRASRLNIVSAIRDLPEPVAMNPEAGTWRGYARAVLNAVMMLLFFIGPYVHVLRRSNFGAPAHERIEGQGVPLWPFLIVPLIPFYLVAMLLVFLMRERNPQPGLAVLVLGTILPPLGLALVACQDRERPISWITGFSVIGLAIGILFVPVAFSTERYFFFSGGVALVFAWIVLTLRYFHVAERASFTTVAALLLAFWFLSPSGIIDPFKDLAGGPEMFFLSGFVMVACATFIIIYNADVLLPLVAAVGSRFGRIVPAVKTAVAYPLTARMRTGMTIMMIGLITFSLAMFSTVNENFANLFLSDDARAGYDTIVFVNSNNQTDDLVAALDQQGVDTSPIVAVSEQRIAWAFETVVFPEGGGDETYTVIGVDSVFFATTELGFKRRAAGYENDEAIWSALAANPALAVIPSDITSPVGPFAAEAETLKLEPELVEEGFAPFKLRLQAPSDTVFTEVTVIGQVDDPGDVFWTGIIVQRETVLAAFPDSSFQQFVIQTTDGIDQDAFAKSIEAGLPEASAESLQELLDEQRAASLGFLQLFQGFMGLGLIIGIAALGVIAFRAVVERRQQIGMLRAIGYQRSMVALSFIFESGFVAISGIMMGALLGLGLSWVLFTSGRFGDAFSDGVFIVPWAQLIVICGIAFIASMVMTWFPAQNASRVAVAEALRYE